MNFLKWLKGLHFHDWVYIKAVYEDAECERLALSTSPGKRMCKKCAKVQIEDVHCLGMHPPEYTRSWLNT